MRAHVLASVSRIVSGVVDCSPGATSKAVGPAMGLLREALGAGGAGGGDSVRHTAEDSMELWLTILDAAPSYVPQLAAPLKAAVTAGQSCPACLPQATEAIVGLVVLSGGKFPSSEDEGRAAQAILAQAAAAGRPCT